MCGANTYGKEWHFEVSYNVVMNFCRFIAERGDGGQLRHVENIDQAFNLKPMPVTPADKPAPPTLNIQAPLQMVSFTPR